MTVTPSIAFTPLKVGNMTLQHRIAMAPLTRTRATHDHVPQDVSAEYYAQRGSYPGTLLVTEATYISKRASGWPYTPGVYSPEQVAGWKKVVDAVHGQGSYVFLQIWALGRAAIEDELKSQDAAFEVVSSSDVPLEGGATPRPLTQAEIAEYVAEYAAAAKAFVEEAGGDGVEIHGANGYLIDQFTQTNSNKRTDKYGGSVENRTRFGLEVVDAVVAAIGAPRTAIRLSPFTDFQEMKMPQADILATFSYFAAQIKARHPDFAYLHLIEPRASGASDATPEAGESLAFITDAWAPLPLLIAGGHKAADAELSARKYENSVAVFGRYFISNPDLVARIQHNVPLTSYDRESFYLPGPDKVKGYTDYPVEYGPEGKL